MIRFFVILFLSNSYLWAGCLITCKPVILIQNMKASAEISKEFADLNKSLTSLISAYRDYLKTYEEQNKLLKKLENLRAYNSKKLNEIIFLLDSTNSLLDLKISEKGENNVVK